MSSAPESSCTEETNKQKINYHDILFSITSSDNGNVESLEDKLQQILQKTLPLLPEDINKFVVNDNGDTEKKYQYLRMITSVMLEMQKSSNATPDAVFSISQLRTVKVAIELTISFGIIPYLLPGVGVDMAKLCPRATHLTREKITELEKYDRLQLSVCALMNLYNDFIFRPAILSQLGPLLATLLQLSHAPLLKPSEESSSMNGQNAARSEFHMTQDLYRKLKKDQVEFSSKLHWLLVNSPQPMIIKELMVILGLNTAPKWLRRETRKYLIDRIMQPNGVISIFAAVCEDVIDLGEHWDKLDTIARLIATSHGNNPEEYYKAICSQLFNLLSERTVKHASTIANCCITALFDSNSKICIKNILDVIIRPLVVLTTKKEETDPEKNEREVELCIENLTKCFITVEAKFKCLPCTLMANVAVPLFCLHNDIRQSACGLKRKIRELLLQLLNNDSLRDKLFAAFLGHDVSENFGNHIKSRFGPSGGIEVVGLIENPNDEELTDSLLDLVSTAKVLSTSLFTYLLKFLSEKKKQSEKNIKQNTLETDDPLQDMHQQLLAVKLLCNLANTPTVQEAQIRNPEPLFCFIKTLFKDYITQQNNDMEEDTEVLYISLMLVKMILSEIKNSVDENLFADFAKFLKETCNTSKMPAHVLYLTREVIDAIESKKQLGHRYYQDLSMERKASNKFEEAIKDLTDPLLPVRAHGLIMLTKLIESMDPCAIARKAVILRLFQENVKHEDSFIYLAAINGLCALATLYPEIVIETLVQEYIDMPQRIPNGEITIETRIKLGEILVKTTRGLGEMASVHKNTLVNGFLCATRDPDHLVRASSLSCLGELCKVLGFRLGNIVTEIIYCITCIIKTDKAPECKRAAVLVVTLLLRGLGKDVLTELKNDLVGLFRGLKHLYDNDEDPVLRLHAQLALEELDHIVHDALFSPPRLEKRIYLLEPSW
ncbi:hypothetical protein KM043_014861 [Ampulex compressa]|nr:hypothetical protein KM043_014861 [Ampulex compressa]